MSLGKLYLIPTRLIDSKSQILLADYVLTLSHIRHFVVEDIRTARRFIRSEIVDFDIDHSVFWEIDKHNPNPVFDPAINILKEGQDVGLLSEAGCPGIADPGSQLVLEAHKAGVPVIPWIGPSSLLLSMMASGMNGQGYTFHGYLPAKQGADLIKKILQLETESEKTGYAQQFIETPYRNQSLFNALCKHLKNTTLLCIATDITGENEDIKTKTIAQWKTVTVDLNKRPTVFILQCP
jgi:16S rRNA (cytidine1402-2'-O)-methyltransferase